MYRTRTLGPDVNTESSSKAVSSRAAAAAERRRRQSRRRSMVLAIGAAAAASSNSPKLARDGQCDVAAFAMTDTRPSEVLSAAGSGAGSSNDNGSADRPHPDAQHRPQLKLRAKIYRFMEDSNYSRASRAWHAFSITAILVSTVTFVLESEVCEADTCFKARFGFLPFDPWAAAFFLTEAVCGIIFTFEYVIRFWASPRRVRFFVAIPNLIDLVAFLPFWINCMIDGFVIPTDPSASGNHNSARFVRAIRVLRVFRLFTARKHAHTVRILYGAIKASVQPLFMLLCLVAVSTLIFSALIVLVEKPGTMVTDSELADWDRDIAHAYCFGTIPSAFWWCLTTMTTVGYGDCYPVTIVGKVISTVLFLTGVLVIALPISVIGSNFQKMVEMFADLGSTTEKKIMSDGRCTLDELREYLHHKKLDGQLRKDIKSTSVDELFERYDANASGYLTIEEFKNMQAALLLTPVDVYHELQMLQTKLDAMERMLERVLRVTHGECAAGDASETARKDEWAKSGERIRAGVLEQGRRRSVGRARESDMDA